MSPETNEDGGARDISILFDNFNRWHEFVESVEKTWKDGSPDGLTETQEKLFSLGSKLLSIAFTARTGRRIDGDSEILYEYALLKLSERAHALELEIARSLNPRVDYGPTITYPET